MVESPRDGSEDAGRADASAPAGIDDATLYVIVRKAVEDAILGAVGTLLLVGVSFVLVWVGVTVALETGSPVTAALGTVGALVGLYVAAATLELVPSIREWA